MKLFLAAAIVLLVVVVGVYCWSGRRDSVSQEAPDSPVDPKAVSVAGCVYTEYPAALPESPHDLA